MEAHELRAWITRMSWSQIVAAGELDVTPETVSRWVNGHLKIDRRTELACRALENEGVQTVPR